MKNFKKRVVKKVSKAPMLWMFCAIALFSLLCFVGMGIETFAKSVGVAAFGIVLSIISFIGMYLTLKFYIRFDLARNPHSLR